MILLFATFQDVMSKILYVLLAFVILMVMVLIHEAGHYTAGKLLKFKINEFSVGMGPKLLQHKKKNGELFTLRLLPLGGYCAFEGEEDVVENPNSQAFNNQKPWKRLIVLVSGALFNFVSAILIAIIAFSCFGETMMQIVKVEDYSPNIGVFKENDILYAVNDNVIYMVSDLTKMINDADDVMTVTVIRDGKYVKLQNIEKSTYNVTDENGNPKTYTGWGITRGYTKDTVKFNLGESIARSFPYCITVGAVVLETIGGLFTGRVSLTELSGPISTIDITSDIAASGFGNVLMLIVLISVNLAIFNLLPVPALDGCKMLFVIIEWIRHKPINRKIEGIINIIGFVFLIGFAILVDLLKL